MLKKKSVFFSATSSPPSIRGTVKESSVFVDELNAANSFKHKARVAHKTKPSTSGNSFGVFLRTDLPEMVMFPGNILWHIKSGFQCIFVPLQKREARWWRLRSAVPSSHLRVLASPPILYAHLFRPRRDLQHLWDHRRHPRFHRSQKM